jgi:hypothetical protein
MTVEVLLVMTSIIGSQGKDHTMSDVTEKMYEEQLRDQENLTVVELTDRELEEVNGAWGDFFCPFNNSTSLAVTSIAFTNNNSGIF